jgi:hypothetical protein
VLALGDGDQVLGRLPPIGDGEVISLLDGQSSNGEARRFVSFRSSLSQQVLLVLSFPLRGAVGCAVA